MMIAQPEAQPAEAATAGPTEPGTTEAATVEPGAVEPGTVEAGTVEPDAARAQAEAAQADLSAPAGAVADSMSVAVWTTISRFSGVLRGIAIAAVLGATYFANTYQFTNSLPNLIFYGLLAGSLFSSLLVPALVRHIDAGDQKAAARVAGAKAKPHTSAAHTASQCLIHIIVTPST